MSDVERAIAQIADIRAQIAASTRFRGYAPEMVAVIGLVSLLLMLAQIAWPARLAVNDRQQVLTWGALLVVAGLVMAIEAISRSRREHGGMAGAMLQGALRTVLPVTIVGIVVAVAVLVYAPQLCWLLPGIWQMLIGVIAFASFATMPRAIVWPAAWYICSGAAVLMTSGRLGLVTPLLAGGPFVAGHFAIAGILGIHRGKRDAG